MHHTFLHALTTSARLMEDGMSKNKAAPPVTVLSPQDIATTLRAIALDAEGKIMLAHVLTLKHMADLVEASTEVHA
jgi:hypothetical protein